jgi:hypothetical protein
MLRMLKESKKRPTYLFSPDLLYILKNTPDLFVIAIYLTEGWGGGGGGVRCGYDGYNPPNFSNIPI